MWKWFRDIEVKMKEKNRYVFLFCVLKSKEREE